jgi:integrase
MQNRVERVLGHDEENKLLPACDLVRTDLLRPAIALALRTGMRRGELLSLEWSGVDLDQRTIRIINAKSTSRDRVIPMNVAVHSVLSELAQSKNCRFVFPSNKNTGQRLLDMKKGVKKALRLASIHGRLRWDDMRHTFATRLVLAGVNLITVSKINGEFEDQHDGPLCSFPC